MTRAQVDAVLDACRDTPAPGRVVIRATPGQIDSGILPEVLIQAAGRRTLETGRLGVEFPEEVFSYLGEKIESCSRELSARGIHCGVSGMASGATSLDYLDHRMCG